MPGTRVGIIAGLYINTGTYEAPDWDEFDLVGDAAVNPNWEEGDATTRQSLVNQAEPTKMALEVTGRARVADDNAVFDEVEAAFIQRNPIDILALNGKIDSPGASGYRFDAKIFTWGEDQAMGNVLFKDFNMKPCASDNDPKFVKVAPDGTTLLETDIGEAPGSL